MIRVCKGRYAHQCLAALIIAVSGPAHAESFVCAAEHASGFIYDETSQAWQVSDFTVAERKYRVEPANQNDIFTRALKYDYEVRDAGSSKPVIHCKSVRHPDSNEETGLIMCRGSFGATFNIDTQTGQYIRSQPTGYLTRQASTDAGEAPYIEIGNCAPG